MKSNYNTLHKYIVENSIKECCKETIDGLFRAILVPVIENQKFENCILFRLFDLEEKESIIKRLAFSGSSIYSYSEILDKFEYENIQKEDIWGSTEFVLILGDRYSSCLIWDYSLSDKTDCSPVCFLYNSKLITEIAKKIYDNSNIDIKDILFKFQADRRENRLLNRSINAIASMLDNKIEEIKFSEVEKKQILKNDDKLETASIVADKAKFIAHEIKNNLSIINLYTKITQKRLENVELKEDIINSVNNALNSIVTASENISSYINDLRCLSAPYITEFELRSVIMTIVMQCEEKARLKGIDIIVNKFDECIVNTDKTKFQCALLNLIFNAIEACNKGNSIAIDCFIENTVVKVFVKNNGAKIPKDIQNKIFEPDFTTKEKGSGIGLAVCRKQMELVNGSISLVHSNNVETLFEIAIPLK